MSQTQFISPINKTFLNQNILKYVFPSFIASCLYFIYCIISLIKIRKAIAHLSLKYEFSEVCESNCDRLLSWSVRRMLGVIIYPPENQFPGLIEQGARFITGEHQITYCFYFTGGMKTRALKWQQQGKNGLEQVIKWLTHLACRFMHAVINLPLSLDWCPFAFWSRHQAIITSRVALSTLFH